jgi:TolB-like protein
VSPFLDAIIRVEETLGKAANDSIAEESALCCGMLRTAVTEAGATIGDALSISESAVADDPSDCNDTQALGSGSGQRLDSWKEIAAYLGRHVTTVQRWERQESLPVHRHVHDKLGSVYAWTLELDEWWRNRAESVEHEDAARQSPSLPAPEHPADNIEPEHPGVRWPTGRRSSMGIALAAFVLAAVVVSLLIAGGAGRESWIDGPSTKIRAVAILPLANLSRDADQEYFSDGITEALITELAKIKALKVISRTSVMWYKGGTKPLREIAHELKVEGVVQGTVVRSGQRVRITARLVDARSDRLLWAEAYERDLHDVLTLQGK